MYDYEERRRLAEEREAMRQKEAAEEAAKMKKLKKLIIGIVAGVLIVVLIAAMWGTVPPNHIGIRVRAGVVQNESLSEGWKFKIPFVDKIISMSNQVQDTRVACGVKDATTDEAAETMDRQLLPVYDFEIKYQLVKENSFSVYKLYGKNYAPKLVDSNAVAVIKSVFSMYHSEEIVTNKETIPAQVMEKLNAITEPVGVKIVKINMKNYDFTPEYTALLEERAYLSAQLKNNEIKQNNERIAAQTAYDVAVKKAEQEAETARIKAENDKTVALIQAENAKEVARVQAESDAAAKKIKVDNEAYVLVTQAEADKTARLAKAEATKAELEAQASGLNELVIQRQWIDKWNGQLIPSFGDGNGFSFTDLTDVVNSYFATE